MAIAPHIYSPQPFTAFVRFRVAAAGAGPGQIVTLHGGDKGPRYLTGFSFSRVAWNIGDLECTFVDDEWTVLHEKLLAAETVDFQFGYEDGPDGPAVRSDWFTVMISSIKPTVIVGAVELSVKAFGLEAKLNTYRESGAHPDTNIDSYARASELAERIIKKHLAGMPGWTSDVIPCEILYAPHDVGGGTELREIRFIQQQQTDLQFIRDSLAPICRKEGTNEGPYVLFADPIKKELYFGPAIRNNVPTRLFKFMSDPYSEVISFDVDSETAHLFGMKGGARVAIPSTDLLNGKKDIAVADNKGTKDKKTILAPYIPKLPGVQVVRTKDAHPASLTSEEYNFDISQALVENAYFAALLSSTTAELTILGDYHPSINPLNVISVLVETPDGKIYHTSGNYLIEGVTDEIYAGSWVTRLKLIRGGIYSETGEKLEGRDATGMTSQGR